MVKTDCRLKKNKDKKICKRNKNKSTNRSNKFSSKKRFLSYWSIFAITLTLLGIAIIVGPIFPVPLALLLGVVFFIIAKRKGWVKKFRLFDLFMMAISFVVFLIILASLGLFALLTVPWWQLILLGLISGIVMWMGDFIPVIGDIISSIIVFILAVTIIGGLNGMIIGSIVALIALIPFTAFGGWINFFAIAIVLIGLKIISYILVLLLEVIV